MGNFTPYKKLEKTNFFLKNMFGGYQTPAKIILADCRGTCNISFNKNKRTGKEGYELRKTEFSFCVISIVSDEPPRNRPAIINANYS